MVGRAPNEEKQALARIRGLFKKANELSRKYDIKTFLLVEDDHATTNPVTWSYQSLETFPSQLGFSAHHRFGPSDFITVSEYRREASAQAGNSSFPIPKFDDADLALLQAVAYTPREPRPTTQHTSADYRPPKRRRSNSNAVDEQAAKSLRREFQDPYNFTS